MLTESSIRKLTPAFSVHLDAIRSLAAFFVVAGHLQTVFIHESDGHGGGEPGPMFKRESLAHFAVIVFFVLSGYLVGSSAWKAISRGRWSWRNYLTQRITRLWIVLIPALLIGGCLDQVGLHYFGQASIYGSPAGQELVPKNIPAHLAPKVLVGNLFFLQNNICVETFGTNLALWSLANEFWYYLIFPLLALALVGRYPVWQRLAYGMCAVAILVWIGSVSVYFPIWLVGFAVSLVPRALSLPYRGGGTLAAAVQFAGVLTALRINPIHRLLADVIAGVSFSIVLYCVLHAMNPIRDGLYSRLARIFSSFSYTLYLVHIPFITVLLGVFIGPWHPWPKDGPHILATLGFLFAAYGYSWILYLLFERNTERLRSWIQRGQVKTATDAIEFRFNPKKI